MDYIYLIPAAGILALIFVFIKNLSISKKEVGNAKMAEIAKNIADGAMAFLKAEYKILSVFVIITAVLLAFKGINEGSSWLVAVSFVVGAFCSGLAGFIGMQPKLMEEQQMLLKNLLEKHLKLLFLVDL